MLQDISMISTRRQTTFDPTTRSIRAARRFVSDAVAGELPVEPTERLVLVASELTTNAVLHARTPFTVTVEVHDDHVRLAVGDGSGAEPVLQAFEPAGVGGRGLSIVEALADGWGIDPAAHGDGKWVWARIGR